MSYPNALQALEKDLKRTPNSSESNLARRLISAAMAYDNFRTQQTLRLQFYPGNIRKDFTRATDFTDDSILGAPWADHARTPLQSGEAWNAGRRASLTGQSYKLDDMGLPLNPYMNTGIHGRGVIGLYGPNHAVDVGILTIRPGRAGTPALHAWGIMKGPRPAFCGGFAEYPNENGHGYQTGKRIWALNQCKEFVEEMISGSVTLMGYYAEMAHKAFEAQQKLRVEKRSGKPLSDEKLEELRKQAETEQKLNQIASHDEGFLLRIKNAFNSSTECYAGPIRSSSRNTNTAWMETYLSWIFMDDNMWKNIRGPNPVFDYQFAAGDDADDVVAHEIGPELLQSATGTHSAMFAFMAASWVLDTKRKDGRIDPSIISQLENAASFMEQSGINELAPEFTPL